MKALLRNWLPLIAVIVMVGASVYAWNRVPDTLPVSWNAQGEVQRFGSKIEALVVMPLASLVLWLVAFFQRGAQAPNARLRNSILTIVAVGLAPLHVGMVANLLGADIAITRLAAFTVGIILLFTGNLVPKARPNLWMGIRTRWALDSRVSWQKVNRAAGWLLSGAGMAFIATALLTSSGVVLYLLVGITVLGAFGLVLYSYLVWKGDSARGPLV